MIVYSIPDWLSGGYIYYAPGIDYHIFDMFQTD